MVLLFCTIGISIIFRLMGDVFPCIEDGFKTTHPGWDETTKKTIRQIEREYKEAQNG
ncbi:MAG: hypothetical protein P9M15_00930 [Candidatus Electryoneaceae bacterium]|nr:hypothetical protein [Candidatus Electryoneaceae bacterium]